MSSPTSTLTHQQFCHSCPQNYPESSSSILFPSLQCRSELCNKIPLISHLHYSIGLLASTHVHTNYSQPDDLLTCKSDCHPPGSHFTQRRSQCFQWPTRPPIISLPVFWPHLLLRPLHSSVSAIPHCFLFMLFSLPGIHFLQTSVGLILSLLQVSSQTHFSKTIPKHLFKLQPPPYTHSPTPPPSLVDFFSLVLIPLLFFSLINLVFLWTFHTRI